MSGRRPFVLVICDGWGYRAEADGNAIAQARTPVFDELTELWPATTLAASGEAVGLSDGQQGNSEVGHLTIGAGRIVLQPLERINRAIDDGSFFDNGVLTAAVDRVASSGRALHCLGLVSPGGVHSHQRHGVALAQLAASHGLDRVYFHVITDGRDEPPRSGAGFVDAFAKDLATAGAGHIATVSGRYYAMDRDARWDRIERAYAVLMGRGARTDLDAVAYIRDRYAHDEGDEFIEPVRVMDDVRITDGDGVIFWNFRPDRARQMAHALVDADFTHFDRGQHPDVHLTTFTRYDRKLAAAVAYPVDDVRDGLCEVVAREGLRQFHVAETEKYAHVTYFINGGREQPFDGEERLLVPSPKVPTYEATPRMSADAIADAVVEQLKRGGPDLIVANFANPDMVGHTGDLAATITAVECVDCCLGRIADAVVGAGGALLVTADHGNAEQKVATDGSPLTAHTANRVPVVLCGTDATALRDGAGLSDVAPTVLAVMGLDAPSAMTGRPLA